MVARGRHRIVLGAAALVLGGCGGDAAPAGPSAADEPVDVEVIAHDIHFDQDTYHVSPGLVRFGYANEGSIAHTLVIEGVGGFELAVRNHGDRTTGGIELAPGQYVVYCDVAGHQAAGMEARLDVG